MVLVKPLGGLIVHCATSQAITLTAGGQWTLTHVSYKKVYVRSIYNILCWWKGHPSRPRQDPVSPLPSPERWVSVQAAVRVTFCPLPPGPLNQVPNTRPLPPGTLPPGILHPILPQPFFSRLTHKGFHMVLLFRCVNTNTWANVRT